MSGHKFLGADLVNLDGAGPLTFCRQVLCRGNSNRYETTIVRKRDTLPLASDDPLPDRGRFRNQLVFLNSRSRLQTLPCRERVSEACQEPLLVCLLKHDSPRRRFLLWSAAIHRRFCFASLLAASPAIGKTKAVMNHRTPKGKTKEAVKHRSLIWSAAIHRRFCFASLLAYLTCDWKNQSGDESPHSKRKTQATAVHFAVGFQLAVPMAK